MRDQIVRNKQCPNEIPAGNKITSRAFLCKIIAGVFLSVFVSCAPTEVSDLPALNFNWLAGKWSNTVDSVHSTEDWVKVNDSLYEGTGVSVYRGDTVFSEQIVIKREGQEVYYIPDVSGELNKQTSKFRLTSEIEGKNYIFENPEHDFPQKIIYNLINNDSIFATVEGIKNGKFCQIKFPFHRVK